MGPVSNQIKIAAKGSASLKRLKNTGVGGRDGTVRKSVGEFLYALHSTCNFSSMFTRFRDIAALLQHSTFPHPISPNFPMFPWE